MSKPEEVAKHHTEKMWVERYEVDPDSITYEDDATVRHMGPVVVDLGDLAAARHAASEAAALMSLFRAFHADIPKKHRRYHKDASYCFEWEPCRRAHVLRRRERLRGSSDG